MSWLVFVLGYLFFMGWFVGIMGGGAAIFSGGNIMVVAVGVIGGLVATYYFVSWIGCKEYVCS
jgi:hypothetical protein